MGRARVLIQLRRRVALKDKFLGLLAHEMRGPLAPMSNALGRGSESVVRLPWLGGSVDSRGTLARTVDPSVPM